MAALATCSWSPSWSSESDLRQWAIRWLTRIYCRYRYLRREKEMKAVAPAESFVCGSRETSAIIARVVLSSTVSSGPEGWYESMSEVGIFRQLEAKVLSNLSSRNA